MLTTDFFLGDFQDSLETSLATHKAAVWEAQEDMYKAIRAVSKSA